MTSITLTPIGVVRSPHTETSQVPKGCGAQHDAEGTIEIREDLAAGLQDIEGFSHLYVIWSFDRLPDDAVELVSAPPTDTRPHGVFASRSPRRPNHLGLTVVRLLGREGRVLRVAGLDMLDGTPVLDIKPYLSNVPPQDLRRGWLAEAEAARAQAHWDGVYTTKSSTAVSWYAPHLDDSLAAITAMSAPDARVIDVGGGASTLVDDLLSRGYRHLTVLDVSSAALGIAQERLGPRARDVHWMASNVLSASLESAAFDVWHDRAVFHFLTDPIHRAAYVAQLRHAVAPGGLAVISTFSLSGPKKCSGLSIVQYDAASLSRELGEDLSLIDAVDLEHTTPSGGVQRFVRCRFRRR
jgi:tRNA-Thr(GGU) m(6)t(6)A37 methyltransferase TsaA